MSRTTRKNLPRKPTAKPVGPGAVVSEQPMQNSDTYEEILERNDPAELDKYLAKEFPDDQQTDKAKGVLANYLKKLFEDAKSPKEMKQKIDLIDGKAKAYYLLTLLRADVDATQLRSKGSSASSFTKNDLETSGTLATIQTTSSKLGYTEWPYRDRTNFVFNDEMLKQVYKKVATIVSPLFDGKGNPTGEISRIKTRLGNYYGLQRYPIDEKETKQGFVPNRNDDNAQSDERIIERNIFRFELFRPENEKDFVFQNTADNLNTILYAFGEEKKNLSKILFGSEDFPKELSEAVQPFFVKVAKKMFEAKKPMGSGLQNYLAKYAPTEKFDTNPSNIVKTSDSEKKMSDNSDAAAQNVPVKDDMPQEIAKDAAQVLKDTDQVVEINQEIDMKCEEEVKSAALKAVEKAETLIKSIEDYDKQSEEAQNLVKRQQVLIEQLKQYKENQNKLQGDSALVQEKLNECTAQKVQLEQAIKALQDQISQLEKEKKDLEQKQVALREHAQKILDEINKYEANIDEIFTLTEKIDVNLQAMDAKDEEKENKLKELQLKLQKRAETIQKRIRELQGEYAKIGQEGDKMLKDCDVKTQELKEKGEKLDALQEELNKKGIKEEKLRNELNACTENSKKLTDAFQFFCNEQKTNFKNLNEKLDQLVEKIKNSIGRLSSFVEAQKKSLDNYAETTN